MLLMPPRRGASIARALVAVSAAIAAMAGGAGSAFAASGLWMDQACTASSSTGDVDWSVPGWSFAGSGPVTEFVTAGSCMGVEFSNPSTGVFEYLPPAGSTVAGGSLQTTGDPPTLETLSGATWSTAWSGSASGNVTVPVPSGSFAGLQVADDDQSCGGRILCSLSIDSGELLLSSSSTPTGSGFAGDLLDPAAHGTANLTFTANDPSGPGVYRVTATVDGQTVYQATPDTNGGLCVPQGTASGSGALIFDSRQPCPQTVVLQIPVDTTVLADGEHRLVVTVENAAQTSSVVLDQLISTDNLTTPSSAGRESPTGSGIEGAAYTFNLDPSSQALTTRLVNRRYTGSAVTLTGVLLGASGAPAVGATVTAQAASFFGSAFQTVAHAVSGADGRFTLIVPAGDSRQLRLIAVRG